MIATAQDINPATPPAEQPGFQIPTVGRRMYYRPGPHDIGMQNNDGSKPREIQQPMDAGVLYVWGARSVNAEITDHAGQKHFRSSCIVRQPGDPEPMLGQVGYVEWMPYQQKKQTEETRPAA